MKTMKIFTKLIISFSVVIILASMLGITGMVTLSSVASPVKEIYQEHLLGVKYTSTALKGLELIRVYSAKLAIEAFTSNQKEMEKVKAELEPIFTEVDENLELFSKTKMNDELYSVFQEVMNGKSMLVEKLNTFKKACDNVYLGNTSTYNDAYNDLASYTSNIEATFEKMTQLKADAALEAKEYGEKIIRISRIVQILMIVIIVISSLAVAIFISAGIEKDLKKMVDQLLVTSQKIGSSVTQLTEASEVLADGSSQQAASIEETSATVNEASSLINQTTENVRQAAQIAKETSKSANDGMTKMSEMVHSMHEIKESSNTVSKIIKTINDIAFQTNLLAINATVEAARAGGEAGRSFSVVAEEVRNLAQKSAKAVDDTTMIIEKNILLTNDGEKISKDVEDYLKQITIESNSLSTIVNEVYVASDEQSGGIRQLNIAISQMDKIIQENAAVAEENAASANSVKEEISNLESVVEIAQSLIRQ